MICLDALNTEEKKAIAKLRERLSNDLSSHMYDDTLLFYRFLKARDFDVDKAEIMLRKHINWRKSFQVDTILETFKPYEVFTKYIEPSFIGFDKEGDIVRYYPAGKIDIRDVVKSIKMNDFMKHWIWYEERDVALMLEENKKTGKHGAQTVCIVDLDQLTLATTTNRSTSDLFMKLAVLWQNNYPERMKDIYIINAPTYYVLLFSIVKKVMSNTVIRKIHVFGKSGDWKEALLETINADILPVFLGGNRRDPDGNPLCKTIIKHGGKMPSVYFLSDDARSFSDLTKVRKMSIPQSEARRIVVFVKERGSVIHWEFEVKDKDIGFGLFYQESAQYLKELLPVQRFVTSDGTWKDSYKSQSIGKYIIIFDNSYSWRNSKEVSYCLTVSRPE